MDLRVPRLLRALVLAVLVTSTVGAAVAVTHEAPVPRLESIAVAEGLPGERGTYEATLEGEWSYGTLEPGTPFHLMDYERRRPEQVQDSFGAIRWAEPVEVHGRSYEPTREEYSDAEEEWIPADAWPWANRTRFLDPADHSLLATDTAAASAFVQNLTSLPVEALQRSTTSDQLARTFEVDMAQVMDDSRFPGRGRDCLFGAMPEGTVMADRALHLPPCTVDRLGHSRPAMAFAPAGNESLDGVPALRFEGESGDLRVRLWLANGLSVPLRYEATQQVRLDRSHTTGTGTFRLDLVAHEPGAAGPPTPQDQGAPAPSWTHAKRQAWGMDETGIASTFPAQKAWDIARQESPTVKSILERSPDAYVASASMSGWVEPNERDRTWSFTVTDGTRHLMLAVREQARLGNDMTQAFTGMALPQVPEPAMTVTYEVVEQQAWEGEGYYPVAAKAPATLPTVASLFARAAAFIDVAPATDDDLRWGWTFSCLDADCTGTRAWLTAQVQHLDRRSVAVGLGGPRVLGMDFRYAQAAFWHDGQASYVVQASQLVTSGTGFGAPAGSDVDPPAPALVAAQAPVFGAGAVATIGISGLLVGLLYYLWPAVKSAGVGLFSRVRADDVLEHPTRARILQAIEAQPGIHQQAIVRLAGVSASATDHHLRKLVEGGLVVRHAGAGFTCYFAKGSTDRRAMGAAPVLKSPVARGILLAAQARPGVTAGALAHELGVAAPTISYHLRRLEAAGLVESRGGIRATQDGLVVAPQAG